MSRTRSTTKYYLVGYGIWLAGVVALELALDEHRVVPILLVVPLIVLATRLRARVLLILGFADLVLALGLGFVGPDAGLARDVATELVIVLVTLTTAWAATLRGRLEHALAGARDEAGHDELTGLANRRSLAAEVPRLVEGAEAASVVLVDVDHFKDINDVHGHPVGDEALVVIGERLRASVREADLVGRYGGEEFLVVVHGDADTSAEVVARIMGAFREEPVPTSRGPLDVRVSIGVAGVDGAGLELAIERADAALYQSKRLGRDRATTWRADATAS